MRGHLVAAVQQHVDDGQEALGRLGHKAAADLREQVLQDLHEGAVLAAQGLHHLAATLKGNHLGRLLAHRRLTEQHNDRKQKQSRWGFLQRMNELWMQVCPELSTYCKHILALTRMMSTVVKRIDNS
eukprot:scaffold109894_cov17-Prasinocladus_malaysianus.AAC.1